jgi:hypothetical protein
VTSTAAAIPDPNGGSGYDVASAITDAARPQSVSPDDRSFSRAEIPYLGQGIGADDRAFSRADPAQANPLTQLRRADARQASEDAREAAARLMVVVHDDGGYRWLHAGEGAAVGFGFAALLAALALLIVRSRRTVMSAA